MVSQTSNPTLQRFIAEQVRRGRFSTPEAVVDAALDLLRRVSEFEPDVEDLQAIEEGQAQLERGEGRPWEELRTQLKAKYLTGK
ncbi:MAG TPA: hypothetical protein VLJ39_22170 [Tepidisphaeraceae bacterium]|jgi:Arc/MetJ-type ribon-helix-helix transcriptional regulator|nr:hypothetical protein [Tepidisphaeraceae bacterium]